MAGVWGIRQCLDFVMFKTYADLKTEADRTYVGFIWWVAEPVLYMAIFYLVFAVVLQRKTEDFIGFLLIGLTCWRWFQSTVMVGGVSISHARGIIHQVYMPKILLPTVAVVSQTLKFLVVFVLLLGFLWIIGHPPSLSYAALAILLLTELILIVGVTYILAAFTPFLPDLRLLLDNFLRGLFFMSGIFFDIGEVSEPYRGWLLLNPMASLIHEFRNVLLHEQWPEWSSLLLVLAISVVTLVSGIYLLFRFDRVYPRLV